jgi:DNA-binding MarR family transcriptional regulator
MMHEDRDAAAEIAMGCVAGRARKISRAVTGWYDEALREHGVRLSQLTMLALIAHMERAAPAQLEEYLSMDRSTVSRNLSRMRAKGWLATVPAEDARTHFVIVAPEGRELLSAALPAWRRAQAEAASRLGSSECEFLRALADSIGGPDR